MTDKLKVAAAFSVAISALGVHAQQVAPEESYQAVVQILGKLSDPALHRAGNADELLGALGLFTEFRCAPTADAREKSCAPLGLGADEISMRIYKGPDLYKPVYPFGISITLKGSSLLPLAKLDSTKIPAWPAWQPNFNDDFKPACGVFRQLSSSVSPWVFRVMVQVESTPDGCAASSGNIVISAQRGDLVQ